MNSRNSCSRPSGSPARALSRNKSAALGYAAIGWSLFPCHSAEDGQCSCGKEDCQPRGKHRENGLAARLLLAYPTSKPKRWTEKCVSPDIQRLYLDMVQKLCQLNGKTTKGRREPAVLCLSPMAKKRFVSFFNSHNQEAAEVGGDVAAAFLKLEAYAARLALVIHCVRLVSGESNNQSIDAKSMSAALGLVAWFKQEAKRIYAMLDSDSVDSSTHWDLAAWIAARGGRVTVRDVQRGNRRFSTSAEAESALAKLVDTGQGTWKGTKPSAKGGKPTRHFMLNTVSTSTKPSQMTGNSAVSSTVDKKKNLATP